MLIAGFDLDETFAVLPHSCGHVTRGCCPEHVGETGCDICET